MGSAWPGAGYELFDGRKNDLKDEIESHLQMATADRIAAGATPAGLLLLPC
jgi:hypothetical protein